MPKYKRVVKQMKRNMFTKMTTLIYLVDCLGMSFDKANKIIKKVYQ